MWAPGQQDSSCAWSRPRHWRRDSSTGEHWEQTAETGGQARQPRAPCPGTGQSPLYLSPERARKVVTLKDGGVSILSRPSICCVSPGVGSG